MLKIIVILFALSQTTNAISAEYKVFISDELTGDLLIENCASEHELNTVVDYAQSLNDESVKVVVKKLISIGPTIMKVGGEGGGD